MSVSPDTILDMAINDIECIWDDTDNFPDAEAIESATIAVIEKVIDECKGECECEFSEYMSMREEQIP